VNALKGNHYVASSVFTSESGTILKTVANGSSSYDSKLEDTKTIETYAAIEKTVEIEDDSNVESNDDDVDSWKTEESSISILANAPSSTSEGPLSFRSINVKSDDGGGSF
jgi:ethylene-insensitive protein 2